MDYTEVKELLKAGFTADEIRSMMNNSQNPQEFPQKEKTEHSKPMPENNSENCPPAGVITAEKPVSAQPEKAENPNIPQMEQLTESISKLIKTIQVSNLQRNTMDNVPAEKDILTQVDTIMAGIIRPEHKT